MKEQEEKSENIFVDDLCGTIYNLSSTYTNLTDIKLRTLGDERKGKLMNMRRIVFDTLCVYVDMLESDATLGEWDGIDYDDDLEDD